MTKKNAETIIEEFYDCSTENQEQFRNYIEAFEQAEWSQPFKILVDSGISLPPPDKLAAEALGAKLSEVISALALMGIYLDHTDHLSDRELYSLLVNDILLEETVIQSSSLSMNCHIDLIGSGSDEDNNLFLKFYASDSDRVYWAKDFPDDQIPDKATLPFDRDQTLPKAYPEKKSSMH